MAKKNVFLEIEKDEKSGREFVKVKKYTPEEVYVMSYVLVKELDNDEKGPESLCPSGPGGGKNWWDEPWKDIALYSTQLASTENIDKTISRLIFEKQGNKRSKALILASQIARLNLTKVKLQILADLLKAIEYYLSNTNND